MARWASWRSLLASGPRKLSQKGCRALSTEWVRELFDQYADNPGERRMWASYERRYKANPAAGRAGYDVGYRFMGVQVDAFLKKRGLVIDEDSHRMLLQCFTDDGVQAFAKLKKRADGDYSEPEWLTRRPQVASEDEVSYSSDATAAKATPFKQLLDGWQRERDPKPSSVEAYRKRLKSLEASVGHDIASRVTRADVQRWKQKMLAVEQPNAKGIKHRARYCGLLMKNPVAIAELQLQPRDRSNWAAVR